MEGLFQKYVITKADGSEVDPEAVYFVLRLDNDPHAQAAAEVYAASVMPENPKLAFDLRYMLQLKSWERFEVWENRMSGFPYGPN